MSYYISSLDNRLYAAKEATYGKIPIAAATDRTPFVNFTAAQRSIVPRRRDKTGSRSFPGQTASPKRDTTFGVSGHLFGGMNPAYSGFGAMLEGAMGGPMKVFGGGTIVASPTPRTLVFGGAHGLTEGQGVCHGDEIRFVAAVLSPTSVLMSAPFTRPVITGSLASPTVTFTLGNELPSLSVFDYWSPASAVHRILRGAGIDEFRLTINGDFHTFNFSGIGADLIDSASFESGQGGVEQFPLEPVVDTMSYDVVPGHLGQIWLGADATRFCTVTEGRLRLNNNLETRNDEFGCYMPKALLPGERVVDFTFSLYERDDPETASLYQAARQRSPLSLTLQLGQTVSQLCGVYVKSFVPEIPAFEDDENRLLWKFDASRAQGAMNDELFVAFA